MAGIDGLTRRDGRLWLERGDGEPVAVTARYLRPLTSRTELVFLDEKGCEVVTVHGLDALDGDARALVEDALKQRYCMATILRGRSIDVRFGTRYWEVDTDRGPRWFALREPGKNVTWLGDGHLVLRDTVGNRFEIPAVGALDRASQRRIGLSL